MAEAAAAGAGGGAGAGAGARAGGRPAVATTTAAARTTTGMGTPMPPVPHVVLGEDEVGTRGVLCVGDVHGCLDPLLDLLRAAGWEADPPQGEESAAAADDEEKVEDTSEAGRLTVIFVGDLCTKGPQSCEVIRFVREQGFLCVRGNHDDAALAARLRVGKYANRSKPLPQRLEYVEDLSEEDTRFLAELPLSIRIPHLDLVVVHAGIVPGVPLSEQYVGDMYTMRNLIKVPLQQAEQEGLVHTLTPTKKGKVLVASEGHKKGHAWIESYEGELGHIVFGHDARRGLQEGEHATGLDGGACYGRALIGLLLPERRLIQIDTSELG